MKQGKCTNLPTECTKAASGEPQIMPTDDTRCSECDGLLGVAETNSGKHLPKLAIFGLMGLLLIVGLIYGFMQVFSGSTDCKTHPESAECLAESCRKDSNSKTCQLYCTDHPSEDVCQKILAESTPAPDSISSCEGADCYADVQVNMNVQGSNTIGSELMPKLLNAYYSKHGSKPKEIVATKLDDRKLIYIDKRNQKFAVDLGSHGSSTGIKALISGQAELAMASRRIKDKEVQALRNKGMGNMRDVSQEFVIGLDGIAVIVHPSNPINTLTTAQLKDIFSGKIKNWSQLDAGNQPITLYVRDKNSGTRDTFNSLVMKKQPVAKSQAFEDSNELSSKVSNDAGGIGYIGLPYINNSKALKIADGAGASAFMPTQFTIATESYPLSRRLYLYVPKNSSKGRNIASFAIGERGQQIVEEVGFTGLTPMLKSKSNEQSPTQDADKPTYSGSNSGYSVLSKNPHWRVNLDFRFDFNSSELDNKAKQDLPRVTAFIRELQQAGENKRLVLVGFADNRGAECINNSISLRRARIVARELAARGIKADIIEGMGSEAPVADNHTEHGREKNRRVELWVVPVNQLPKFPIKETCVSTKQSN